ncbi:MAG TPA: cytochrome c3 family protein [Psychromonas sp.]
MKLIKTLLLSFTLCCAGAGWAEELPNPSEDNLANFHLKDEDCAGACHEKEGPSDDLEFEQSSCIECHDEYGLLEGKWHNIKHRDDEDMPCTECHIPHEKTDPKEFCGDCHDDDHAAFDPLFKYKALEENASQFLKEK